MAAQPAVDVKTELGIARMLACVAEVACAGNAPMMVATLLGAIIVIARRRRDADELLGEVADAIADARRRIAELGTVTS